MLSEGEVTESEYLSAVKGRDVTLSFGPTGDPLFLLQQARQEVDDNRRKRADERFDEIWCVFDRDEHQHFDRVLAEVGQDAAIQATPSNPCFEFWLVLHVEDWTASVDRHQAQARCKALGLTEGKHVTQSFREQLGERFSDAKRRAQGLQQGHEQVDVPPWANPSSSVWRLVDRLRAPA